jgi:hypothetical protein
MTPIEYLFIGLLTVLIVSGWTLWTACRRADDGYEDTLGFHFGIPPVLSLRMEASLVCADALPSVAPGRRRRGNSRAPFKVASAAPFESAAPKRRRPKRVDSTPPMAVSAQAVFNKILGQESAQ